MYCRCTRQRNGSDSRFGRYQQRIKYWCTVSDVTETNVPSTQSVQELLAVHPADNFIWDHTDLCDILIDTMNSAEAMVGSHIVEPEYIFCKPNPGFEYIKHVVDVSSDIIEEDGLYEFMDKYVKWDDSPNTAVVGNDTGSSHIFTAINTSGSVNKSIKSDFWISKRQL